MGTKRERKAVPVPSREDAAVSVLSLPAAEVLSFFKETRGVPSWNIRDLAKSLNISAGEAKRVTALLQLQGYIEPSGRDEWLTTLSGETVSGSKPSRFTMQAIEAGLSALTDRIKTVNQDPNAPYKITKAVAFGSFLSGRPRIQAADVGIELLHRGPDTEKPNSATAQAARNDFLRQLRGRSSVVRLRPYEDWMSSRTHRSLV